jgi:hypothetical protein
LRSAKYLAVVLLSLVTTVNGATLVFDQNPLTGIPNIGGQVVNGGGGGPVFSFDPLQDLIAFNAAAFGVGAVDFANGNTTDPGFPTTGITVAVVRNASGARGAAIALGNQLTTPGAGFFIYFNGNLNVPRLVFSRDLDDPNADLAILARFNNLQGQNNSLESIQASNFQAVPEPSSLMFTLGGLVAAPFLMLRRRRQRS